MDVLLCIAFIMTKVPKDKSLYQIIRTSFWYREPKDYIEVIDPPIIDEYEIPHLKAKEKSTNN